jgi:putative colanic acid biosynthesis glycosyltransferase WcaI
MSDRARKPRILVINQYYRPGFEATAQLLGDLCEAIAERFDVSVVTGALAIPPAPSGRFDANGVRVVRVRSTTFDRAGLGRRALNYVTFLVGAFAEALGAQRPDVVLSMTDPPIVGDVALLVARRFRAPLVVISQDVFPEIAVQLGRLENPALIGLLRGLIRFYLRRADRIVAIGDTMRDRLVGKGAARERISVIPNWVDTMKVAPAARDNPWAREHGFDDRFVVMHSGNIGHAQNLDALVRSMTFLRDLDDVKLAIVGGGARQAALTELVERLETEAVEFLPYQPRELLSLSLSSADVHVVGLARGLAGYVVPSRLYGILAVGRPVFVAAEDASETAQLVAQVGCGVVVPPGRPELLAEVIRAAHAGEYDLAEMGRRGREYVIAEADRRVAVERYERLLLEVVGE